MRGNWYETVSMPLPGQNTSHHWGIGFLWLQLVQTPKGITFLTQWKHCGSGVWFSGSAVKRGGKVIRLRRVAHLVCICWLTSPLIYSRAGAQQALREPLKKNDDIKRSGHWCVWVRNKGQNKQGVCINWDWPGLFTLRRALSGKHT